MSDGSSLADVGRDAAKGAAGRAAAAFVQDGAIVGLGTGTTARRFIDALGDRCRAEGLRVRAVATSDESADQAFGLGIPLADLGPDGVDIAVDGADQIDPALGLVKGRGGALVRERIVASAARRFIVIVDESKLVDRLVGPIPVEILPFGAARTLQQVSLVAGEALWRPTHDGETARSDNGNLLADLRLGPDAPDLETIDRALTAIPGLVGHGLFLGLSDMALVARSDGTVLRLVAGSGRGPTSG